MQLGETRCREYFVASSLWREDCGLPVSGELQCVSESHQRHFRWCPAHKGIASNGKADEWAAIAAEEPDGGGVEWLSYTVRAEARAMPLPTSLANIKREISEKMWEETHQFAAGQISKRKYRIPKSQKPDGTDAGSTNRLASRIYQLKTRRCLTGQHLQWTRNPATPSCWWCRYPNHARVYHLKVCPEWKAGQKILWAEARREIGRCKDRWNILSG